MCPITVVTSVFNGGGFLKEAIESILTQSFTDFEYIIVNDGSTDNTKVILNEIKDPRVKIIHLEKNQGTAKCLNLAIEKARGRWIAIQDADDISFPNRLEEQYNFLNQSPDVNLVGSYISCFSHELSPLMNQKKKEMERLINGNTSLYTGKYLFYGMSFCHGTFMFSKNIFQELNGYSVDFQVAYDYELLVKFFSRTKIEKLRKKLYQYRLHQDSLANKDLVKTNLESIEISVGGIIEKSYENKKIVIIGTNNACVSLKENIQTKFSKNNFVYVNQTSGQKCDWHKPSIFIILDFNGAQSLVNTLEKEGLILNHDFFLIWNLTN